MYYCSIKLPFQPEFSIMTPQVELIEQIRISFGDNYVFENSAISSNIISIKNKNGEYLVGYRGVEINTIHPVAAIQNIVKENTYYENQYLVLHGAAVAHQHKASVFLAPTLGGKTTLTSFLVANGFQYITEDCVFINTSNMTIYPYSAPIHLRLDSINILKAHGVKLDALSRISCRDSERFIYLPRNCVKQPLPIQNIFILARNDLVNKTILISEMERIYIYFKSLLSSSLIASSRKHILELSKKESRILLYKDMSYVRDMIKNTEGL